MLSSSSSEKDLQLVTLKLPSILPDDENPVEPHEAVDAGDESDETQELPRSDVSPQ